MHFDFISVSTVQLVLDNSFGSIAEFAGSYQCLQNAHIFALELVGVVFEILLFPVPKIIIINIINR